MFMLAGGFDLFTLVWYLENEWMKWKKSYQTGVRIIGLDLSIQNEIIISISAYIHFAPTDTSHLVV